MNFLGKCSFYSFYDNSGVKSQDGDRMIILQNPYEKIVNVWLCVAELNQWFPKKQMVVLEAMVIGLQISASSFLNLNFDY